MSGKPDGKYYFAAVPARAFFNRDLDGGRFQLLAAIALSNRLGAGQGCWKSARTLGALTGLQVGTVKNYLIDLIAWGYLIREPRPGSKTQRSLFVVYDQAADRAAMARAKADVLFPDPSSADDALAADPSSGDAQPVISRSDASERRESEIARSASSPTADALRPSRGARERNSAEAASCKNGTRHDVEFDARTKALYPSRCPVDGEFYRLAKAWVRDRIKQQEAGQLTDVDRDEAERILTRCREIEDSGEPHLGDGLPAAVQVIHGDILWLLDPPDPPDPPDPNVWPVLPQEMAEPVLAYVAQHWPDRSFTLSAAHTRAQGGITRRLLAATLDHLCEQGRLERRRRSYRLRVHSDGGAMTA